MNSSVDMSGLQICLFRNRGLPVLSREEETELALRYTQKGTSWQVNCSSRPI